MAHSAVAAKPRPIFISGVLKAKIRVRITSAASSSAETVSFFVCPFTGRTSLFCVRCDDTTAAGDLQGLALHQISRGGK